MAEQELITKLGELTNVDFTALDYSTIQQELIKYIKTAQSNQGLLDNFLEGDAAKLQIDLLSYLGNLLAFRIDTQAAEGFLPTAQRRQSLINLLELVGQKVRGNTAAQVTLQSVPSPISRAAINIPARFSFATTGLNGNDVTFEIMNDATDYFNFVTIPPNVTNFNVKAFSGQYKSFNITATGEPNFTFTLPQSPVVDGSIKVSVTPVAPNFLTPEIITSARITEVDSLVNASNDYIYRTKIDENGRATLTFATEFFGRIPENGFTVHVDYRIAAGSNTNVPAGSIETTSSFTNDTGETVSITFTNPDSRAVGGLNQENLETTKLAAPAKVRANNNTVTTDDIESVISNIAGVQDVFSVDRYDDINTYSRKFAVDPNSVKNWVLPDTSGEISPDLRQIIAQELGARRMTGIESYFVFNPDYVDWILNADIVVESTAQINDTDTTTGIRTAITTALQEKFGKATAKFNRSISFSNIITTIQNIAGVVSVNMNNPTTNLDSSENQVLRLLDSNITLNITN